MPLFSSFRERPPNSALTFVRPTTQPHNSPKLAFIKATSQATTLVASTLSTSNQSHHGTFYPRVVQPPTIDPQSHKLPPQLSIASNGVRKSQDEFCKLKKDPMDKFNKGKNKGPNMAKFGGNKSVKSGASSVKSGQGKNSKISKVQIDTSTIVSGMTDVDLSENWSSHDRKGEEETAACSDFSDDCATPETSKKTVISTGWSPSAPSSKGKTTFDDILDSFPCDL